MYVGNCMDEEATYRVDDPGGDYSLQPGHFREHSQMKTGSEVTLYNGPKKETVDSDNSFVLFHKEGSAYWIEELFEEV